MGIDEGNVEAATQAGGSDRWSESGVSVEATISATRAEGPEGPDAVRPVTPGTTIGRYVVLGKLGAGAMGVVHAAHDPELDRRVALKLLRVRGSEKQMKRGQRRLMAEAQALARLNHPHVVGVHDVGVHGGQVFVAMEYVDGLTLTRWLASRRSWVEVLDVLLQAGRGIAAAHQGDLVHRDFKPDNVMVGDDGRVRVMDFGLARAVEGAPSMDDASSVEERPATLTRTEGIGLIGTPAYMAPEQLSGHRGDALSDQFSFCVTAWEALFGARPFVAETLPELASQILRGAITEPLAEASVPSWLRRVVQRGLSLERERRWASMDELLAALERGRARAGRRPWLLAVGGVATLLAGAWGWQQLDLRRTIADCEAEGASIAEIWNPDRAEELRAALVASGSTHAEVTADKVIPWLDTHAEEWQQARTEICHEVQVENRGDAETLQRSRWCLDERRMELEALVNELMRGESRGVDRAVSAVSRLVGVEPCRDALALSRRPTPPDHHLERVAKIRGELVQASALKRLGAYDEGLQVAQAALADAEALGWPPLEAAARLRVGLLHEQLGEYARAEEAIEKAYFEAGRADATDVMTDSARALVTIVGTRQGRPEEGLRWAEHLSVAMVRTPDPAGLRESHRLMGLANVAHAQGDFEEAKALFERALDLRAAALGPDHLMVLDTTEALAAVLQQMGRHQEVVTLLEPHLERRRVAQGPRHPEVGNVLNNLAVSKRALGQISEARDLYVQTLDIWEATLGPDHPHVAQLLNNLANAHFMLGDIPESKRLHRRALDIRRRVLDPEALEVAQSLGNLANVHTTLGEHDRALDLHSQTLAILEKKVGPDHPELARTLLNYGIGLRVTGHYDHAREALTRALGMQRQRPGEDGPMVGPIIENLADLYVDQGELEAAKEAYTEALEIANATMGLEHPERAHALLGLSLVARRQGRPEDAVRRAEEALRVRINGESSPVELSIARFELALALSAANRDAAQTRALAEEALAGLGQEGPDQTAEEIRQWLAEHPPP